MIQFINSLFGIVFSIFESIVGILSDVAVSAIPSRRKTNYDADFGKPSEILQKNGDGFYIGTWSSSLKESHSHMIALGGSGSNKSTSIVFNTLLQSHSCSYIIHDPSKEIFNGTATALIKAGYKISMLDYNHPEISRGFNVLSKCKSYSDVDKVANVIVRNSLEGSSYDYWAQSAEATIAFFCKYLIGYADPKYANLANVLHMLRVFSYAPDSIDQKIIATQNPQLISEYKGMVATPDKTLQSTLATAKTALRIYENLNVGLITSFDTIDFESFKQQKQALYICSGANDAFLYRAISGTFFESFFSSILSKPPYEKGIPIMFLIDEASSMKLSSLSQALALTRKHSTSIATLWQDYNQIEHLYGKYEAVNIFANSHLKVFMPSGQPLETCRMLEQLIGKFHFTDDKGILRTRELLTAQEIHELKRILVLSGNKPPLLLDVNPYFEQKKLKRLAELPVYQVESQLPFDAPPLIQFDEDETAN